MARTRNLKPSFFTDAELLECDFWVRLLYQGLWVHADARGILADSAKQIKIDVFPADSVDIEVGLSDLAARGFIVRYRDAGGRPAIFIPAFGKHQSPHPKEPLNTLSTPEESVESLTSNLQVTDTQVSRQRRVSETWEKESKQKESTQEATEGVQGEPTPEAPPPKPRTTRKTYPPDFESFWRAYPDGHGDKALAFSAWQRVPEEDRAAIPAGLEKWKGCERWQRGVILAADQFLKRRRWEAAIPPPPNGLVSPNGHDPEIDLDMSAWLQVIKDKEYEAQHGSPPDEPTTKAIHYAVQAIGGWGAIDATNGFQRRDFIAAHRTERHRAGSADLKKATP